MLLIKPITFDEIIKNNYSKADFFQTPDYNQIFTQHFFQSQNLIILGVFQKEKMMGYGFFEKQDEVVILSGMKKVEGLQEVTDYGDMVFFDTADKGQIWPLIIDYFKKLGLRQIILDYVRADSNTYIYFQKHAVVKEIAPLISLATSWEAYLDSLERTDRKELKRKLRRLETVSYNYQKVNNISEENLSNFFKLHRLSSSDKDRFLSKNMEDFFQSLSKINNQQWSTVLSFLEIENKQAACIFSFESKDKIYCYNSGYDPDYNYYSAGLLVHALSIKRAIEEKKSIYDFLRGDERYKFDLGAKPISLYQITINL